MCNYVKYGQLSVAVYRTANGNLLNNVIIKLQAMLSVIHNFLLLVTCGSLQSSLEDNRVTSTTHRSNSKTLNGYLLHKCKTHGNFIGF
jgi:hypothetical protein